MSKLLCLLLLVSVAGAEDIPDWILIGIPRIESKSYWTDDGTLIYVDKRRGSHGELGPFQCTRIAFNQVKLHGEQFWRVETDREFAATIAARYLLWLYKQSGSWDLAVQWYNHGPHHRSPAYLAAVKAAGGAE